MGKIRVKALGDENLEKETKKEAKKRSEQKKQAKAEQVEEVAVETPSEAPTAVQVEEKKEVKKQKSTKSKKPTRSEKYLQARMLVDANKQYSLSEALDLLPKLKLSKTDETVELHVNTTETGISGNLTLPHGTGKKTRVAVANDKLIDEVTKGVISFDVLVATPDMMPKLAKVAKFLGPRGLMPSPKNGTVTQNPDEIIKKYEGGQIRFKTESKAPVIHLTVGKLSFDKTKLKENITTVVETIQSTRIKKVILKSTMSPAIKLNISNFN